MTFLDGGNPISGAVALTAGAATFNINTLTAGAHNISFSYSGDTNFAPLTSGASTLNVTSGAPTVSAPLSSAGATFTYGTTTNLQSTVTPASPLPTGTVQFFDGATSLGTAALVSGTATINNVLLAGGVHNNITAVYSGDSNWASATSPASSITVTRATPTLTVTGAPFSAVYGGTLSAGSFSIAGAGGPAAAPTGSVATSIGATTILTSNSPFAGSVPVTGTPLPATVTANLIQIAFAYGGDTNYLPITTNAAIAIARANPTTAVAFNPNPVAVGVNEAITATTGTAIPGAQPTGNVTFLDGGNPISGAVGLTAGAATFNINTLTAGAHNISFSYSGDTNFAPLTSGASTLNVTSGAPTVSAPLSSAGATFTYGTFTNLQSTVTPANPLPTGTIEFFDGATSLGSAALVSGTATLNNVLLAGGVHNNITAVYSGDANWTTATSPAATVTVNRATPTLIVTGAPFSAVYGGTLSAGSFSIAGLGEPTADPTGSVATSVGAVTILTSNSPFAGSVTVTGTPLPATVTANLIQIAFAYGGDTNYLPITTNAAIAIARANPTTAVAFNPNPVAVGINEAITATTGTAIPGAQPTGNVTFLDGGNPISGAVALTAGAATFNINTLTAGAHSISFSYSGDTNFAPLTSGASTLNVTSGAPTVSAPLSSAGATFTYGTTTNLQSTVTPANPLPTGTIEFFDGATSLGTAALVSGTATLNNRLLAGGVHNNITAVYSGDANWTTATSPAATVTVNRATPTLNVTGAPFSAVYGGTLSAGSFSIAGPGEPTADPTGSVVTSIGAIAILTSNSPFAGSVPVTGTPLPATVTANQIQIAFAYGGDTNYLPITTHAAIAIARANPTTAVAFNPNPVAVGINEAITATTGTAIPGAQPTGTVTFLDGGNPISGAVALTAGAATFNINTLTAGAHNISFSYSGDTNFAPLTSGASTLDVTKGNPTVAAVTSSAGVSYDYGTTTNLLTTLTPANPLPTGSVTFFNGNTSLGTATLNGSGTASLSNILLPTGADAITAVYAGDSNWNTATSAPTTVTVNRAAPTFTSTGSPFSAVYGGTLSAGSFTLSGVASPGVAPSGTVTVSIGPAAILTSNSPFTASVPVTGTVLPANVSADLNQVSFAYSGDTNYLPATVTGQIAIAKATLNTQLTAATNPILIATSEALTAKVITAIPGALPTGSVTFLDGATPIPGGSNVPFPSESASVTFNTAGLSLGNHAITFTYSGDTNFNGATSSPLGILVYNPLVVTPAATVGTVRVPYTSSASASGGVPPYTFTAQGLPPGITMNAQGLLSGLPAQAGTSTATFTVTDSIQNTASIQGALTINPPLLTISGNPPAGVVGVPYVATIEADGGADPLAFALAGGALPPGLSFGDGVIRGTPTAPGTFAFVVRVSDSTGFNVTGNFSIRIDPAPLTIGGGSSTPTGNQGSLLSIAYICAGGVPPYSFSATGSLPAGMSFADCILSGTPTTTGTFQIRLTLMDTTGASVDRDITLTITPPALTLGGTLPDGQVGVAYSATIAATGGVAPFTYATASALPDGLALASNGVISGTPAADGQFSFTVTVTDAANSKATASFTIAIVPATLSLGTPVVPPGTMGVPYSATITATGGVKPYTFSFSGLPGGLQGTSDGVISGIPDTPGDFTATVTITDSSPSGDSQVAPAAKASLAATTPAASASTTFSMTIAPAALVITTSAAPDALVGTAYSLALTATGGTAPYTFSATGLPGGLAVSAGAIGGTPTAPGTFTVVVTATDADGMTATKTLTLTVGLPSAPPLVILGITDTAGPLQQPRLQVALADTFPTDVAVTLTMTFKADNGPDDLAIQFSSGGRIAHITVPAGSTAGATDVGVQTGSVAGLITITASMQATGQDVTPSPAPTRTIRIAAAAPVILPGTMTAVRNATGFTVTLSGFVTDREITQAIFTFTPAAGSNLQTTTITLNVEALFAQYFGSAAAAAAGSQFTFTQPFTVAGSAQSIASVTVTLVNKIGQSTAVTVPLKLAVDRAGEPPDSRGFRRCARAAPPGEIALPAQPARRQVVYSCADFGP